MTLAACTDDAASSVEAVVYGSDDRTEVYAHPSATLRSVASSSVAMMVDSSIVDDSNPADVQLTYSGTLGEDQGLCAGQPFYDQPDPGSCSGTLIDSRHIMTAGHCVSDGCTSSTTWVLGYRYASAGTLATLTSDDIYTCAGVVTSRETDTSGDYAIVTLDREVVGHTPATISTSTPTVGGSLNLIGHPDGIPMKIASNGAVVSVGSATLNGTVDAFAGNSGSGVFDDSGEVVGILVSGETDFVRSGRCYVVNTLSSTGVAGESMTIASVALAAYCATSTGASSTACGGSGMTTTPDGDTCADATSIAGASATFTTSLAEYAGDATGSCGGDGPDRFYTFTLTSAADVTATASGFDTVLYLLDGCGGAEEACNDDVSDSDRGSSISASLSAGTYVLVVDAYDSTVDTATIELTVTPTGSTGTDAGTSTGTDAAVVGSDAAVARVDAGSAASVDGGMGAGVDGGVVTRRSSDCACATPGATGSTGSSASIWGLSALALAFAHRRRASRG